MVNKLNYKNILLFLFGIFICISIFIILPLKYKPCYMEQYRLVEQNNASGYLAMTVIDADIGDCSDCSLKCKKAIVQGEVAGSWFDECMYEYTINSLRHYLVFESENKLLPYSKYDLIEARWCFVESIRDYRIRGIKFGYTHPEYDFGFFMNFVKYWLYVMIVIAILALIIAILTLIYHALIGLNKIFKYAKVKLWQRKKKL